MAPSRDPVSVRAPSLAGLALLAFLVVAVVRSTIPLVDGDVWWHLRAGATVLSTGAVPRSDSWTLAGQGMPWISQDWLANLLMAAVERLGGPWGATLLSIGFGLAAATGFALLAAALRGRGAGWLSAVSWLAFGLVVAGPTLGVRVQTLDLPLAAASVYVLWGYLHDRRRRWLLALPALAAAWVNLHAGFPILFGLGGALALGEALDRATRRRPEGALSWRQIGWLMLALAAAAVALLLNPNGPAIYAYPFATSSIAAHRELIFEWSAPDLSSFPGQALFALLVLGVVPTLLLARRTMPACDALWLIGLALAGMTAIRFVGVVGPIAGALCALHLTPRLAAAWPGADWAVLRRMSQAPRRTRRVLHAALPVVILATGMGMAVARSAPPVQSAAVAEAMPVAATAWLASQHPRRIFNVYAWGGYIGRELTDALVFIDGRSDIYGDAPIRAYARVIGLQADPRTVLDAYHIDHVIFWPRSPLADWLDRAPGWRRVYEDGLAAVWARN